MRSVYRAQRTHNGAIPHESWILRVSLAFGIFLITFAGNGFAAAPAEHGEKESAGAVYALTNAPTGNEVVVWNRAADGIRSLAGSYATGGLGSGAGLGSQGAIIFSKNGRTGVTNDNPSDMALSANSQYLYVHIGRTGSIASQRRARSASAAD